MTQTRRGFGGRVQGFLGLGYRIRSSAWMREMRTELGDEQFLNAMLKAAERQEREEEAAVKRKPPMVAPKDGLHHT